MTDSTARPALAADAPPPYGPPISLADAQSVAKAAQAESVRRGWPMVIAVVDSGGHLVVFYRLDQSNLGSIAVAQAKANTAVGFRRSTKSYQDLIASGGTHLRLLAAPNLLPVEGGLPLMRDGCIVGAIGVSGMAPNQDAEVAAAGAAALV
jgi:glc operon protein GlcG